MTNPSALENRIEAAIAEADFDALRSLASSASARATTPLISACVSGDLDSLQAATDVDLSHPFGGWTPLQYAIGLGHAKVAKELLRLGADPEQRLRRLGWFVWESAALEALGLEWRPLHMAVLFDRTPNLSLLNALLGAGAQVESTCSLGLRPIHLAATADRCRAIERLAALGAGVDRETDKLAEQIVRLMPDAERCLHLVGRRGRTALQVAASEGHARAARTLLQLGADPNATDSERWTALHHAARPMGPENTEMVQLLLRAGASAEARSTCGERAQALAASCGHTESARLLD